MMTRRACALAVVALAAVCPPARADDLGLAGAPELAALRRRDPGERLALVDLVRYRDAASGSDRYRAHLERLGARVVWAGHVDQQFIGQGDDGWDDLVVSEAPSVGRFLEALTTVDPAEIDAILVARRTTPATPWPWYGRLAARTVFGILNLVGGGPAPLAPGAPMSDAPAPGAADPLGPTADQLRAYATGTLATTVVMFNFLRYGGAGGKQSYDRYGNAVEIMIGRLGGRIRWLGWPYDGAWDTAVAVEYPSRAAFLGMVASPEYRAITGSRSAGLGDTKLLACTSWPEFYAAP